MQKRRSASSPPSVIYSLTLISLSQKRLGPYLFLSLVAPRPHTPRCFSMVLAFHAPADKQSPLGFAACSEGLKNSIASIILANPLGRKLESQPKHLKIGGFCDFQLHPFICRKGLGVSRIFFGSLLFEKKKNKSLLLLFEKENNHFH